MKNDQFPHSRTLCNVMHNLLFHHALLKSKKKQASKPDLRLPTFSKENFALSIMFSRPIFCFKRARPQMTTNCVGHGTVCTSYPARAFRSILFERNLTGNSLLGTYSFRVRVINDDKWRARWPQNYWRLASAFFSYRWKESNPLDTSSFDEF